jgi:hypothetical protein
MFFYTYIYKPLKSASRTSGNLKRENGRMREFENLKMRK